MLKYTYYLITIIIIFLFTSCQEKTKGCLDPNATNFDISADEDCQKGVSSSNCPCVYPYLVLNTNYLVLGKNKTNVDTFYQWTSKYTLTNAKDQYYNIRNVTLYIDDIQLVKSDNSVYSTKDSIPILIKNLANDSSQIKILKDFSLLNSQKSSTTIGNFEDNGNFSKIRFKIGLQTPINQVYTPNKTLNSSSDELRVDSLYLKNSFNHYAGVIAYKSDTASTASTNFIRFIDNFDVELNFPANNLYERGRNINVKLRIDYSQWFVDVDFKNDSAATIQQKVLQNIKKGWEIIP